MASRHCVNAGNTAVSPILTRQGRSRKTQNRRLGLVCSYDKVLLEPAVEVSALEVSLTPRFSGVNVQDFLPNRFNGFSARLAAVDLLNLSHVFRGGVHRQPGKASP